MLQLPNHVTKHMNNANPITMHQCILTLAENVLGRVTNGSDVHSAAIQPMPVIVHIRVGAGVFGLERPLGIQNGKGKQSWQAMQHRTERTNP